MKPFALTLMLLGASAAPAFAQSSGGDREPAGGAFMSSYSKNPYEADRRFPQAAEPSFGARTADLPATTGSLGARKNRRRH